MGTITIEEAINIFKGKLPYADGKHGICCDWGNDFKAFEMAIKVLEQTRWIPVTERLPEEGERVFVTQIFGERTVVYCTVFPFEKTKEKYITAWMPLPEPYKAEEV